MTDTDPKTFLIAKLVGVLVFLAVLASPFLISSVMPPSLPECDSPEVCGIIERIVNAFQTPGVDAEFTIDGFKERMADKVRTKILYHS